MIDTALGATSIVTGKITTLVAVFQESSAFTAASKCPNAFGVPLMVPLTGSRTTPGGSVPVTIAQLTVPTLPVELPTSGCSGVPMRPEATVGAIAAQNAGG